MWRPRKLAIARAILRFFRCRCHFGTWRIDGCVAPPPVDDPLWTAFMILCPPALLSLALIDIEPGLIAIVVLWVIIGISNAALYAALGAGVRRMFRKSN
jgi:hypothetical protein